jgi:hypothetical protein
MNADTPQPEESAHPDQPPSNTQKRTGDTKGNPESHTDTSASQGGRIQNGGKNPWLEYGPQIIMALCTIGILYVTWRYTDYAGRQLTTMIAQSSDIHAQTSAAIRAAKAAMSAADTARDTLNEQKREFTTQSSSSNKQFSTQLARINAGLVEQNRLAAAAEGQLGTAKNALAISKNEMLSSERPYLLVTIKGDVIYWHNFVRVDVQAANYGKSPAVHVRWRGKLSVFTDGSVPIGERIQQAFRAVPQYKKDGTGGIIPATGQPSEFATFQTAAPLTDAQLQYAQNSIFGWVVAGVMTYSDLFGNTYSTKYCFPHYPGSAMPECDRGDMR